MLRIQTTAHNEGVQLQLAGNINGRSYKELAVSLDLQRQHNPAFIIINLTDIRVITSIGLQVIFDTYKQLDTTCPLMLCGLNQDIHQLITIMGLSRLLPVYKDFDSAIHSLDKTTP